ncbi:DUF5362 family protein [Orbus sturtevantii]|uniref:DUF5362 family protein n=1 Tax=Orbus sturtevantii TaxID=3074109 RepID=UPI00370D0291
METIGEISSNIMQIDVDPVLIKKMSFIGTVHKIFGVLSIIGGAITCLGIITAIFGVPYIIAGIKLFKSGSSFSYAAYSKDGNLLKDAIMNLASFWLFNLIAIAAIFIFYALFFIIMMMAIGSRGYY